MANPLPCKIHESNGEHALADWLITAQSEGSGFKPGATFYVCQECLAGLMVAWLQEQQQPAEDVPEGIPEGPGVLEAIEADEGPVPIAGRNGRKSKSKPEAEGAAATVETQETAAADVHE